VNLERETHHERAEDQEEGKRDNGKVKGEMSGKSGKVEKGENRGREETGKKEGKEETGDKEDKRKESVFGSGTENQRERSGDASREMRNLLSVAGFEFRRNFFSVKMLVAGSIFIFVILASTMGLAQLSGYQFSLEPDHREHLIEGPVPSELKTAFEEQGHPLGNDTWMEPHNEEWIIYIGDNASYRISNDTHELKIYNWGDGGFNTLIGRVLLELDEPDWVMSTVSGIIANIMALITVVFGFSTITSELNSRTVDLLVTKPMKIGNIISGKVMGISAALSIPVTICIPLCSLIIYRQLGSAPSVWGSLGFWFFSVIFIATFVLFSLLFATLARRTATSVILGISLFLLFTFFWNLISYAVQYLLGCDIMDVSNEKNLIIYDTLGLLNPVINYQNSVALVFSSKDIHGIPPWLPPVFLILMMVGLIFLTRHLFYRRIRNQDY